MTYPKRSALAMFWKGGGWAAVVIVAMGVAFGSAAVVQRTFAQKLSSQGVTVPGVVTTLTQTGIGDDRRYRADYAFTTAEGETVSASQVIAYGSYRSLSEGQDVEVTYLPSDPSQSEVIRGRTGRSGWVFMLFSAAMLAGGLVWGWIGIGRSRIEVALREHGTLRRATVIAHEVAAKSNDQPIRWIARWRDETGAEGKTLPHKDATLPKIDATIRVYADPKGGAKAVWEGDVGTR